MFKLKRTIARNRKIDLNDTAVIKIGLTSLGYYDDTETGLSPYADDDLFHSIKAFQKDHNLEVDGVIKPDGPTQAKMKEKINENEKAGNAFMDFKRNFEDMNATRLEGGDKYFHCKANYEAASRGWVGKMTSKILSDVKEMKDMYIDADPSIESQTDQIANYHGREAVLSGKYTSAKEACAIFRPKGLDDKY